MARKAWLKNGKIVMRDGKVVMCGDCPCGEEGCECQGCGPCVGGSVPAWIKVVVSGVTGTDPNASDANGEYTLKYYPPSPDSEYTDCLWMLREPWAIECPGIFGPFDNHIKVVAVGLDPNGTLMAKVIDDDLGTQGGIGYGGPVESCSELLGQIIELNDEGSSACVDFTGATMEIIQLGPPRSISCCN